MTIDLIYRGENAAVPAVTRPTDAGEVREATAPVPRLSPRPDTASEPQKCRDFGGGGFASASLKDSIDAPALPPFGRDHAHADALEALAEEATYRRHRAALATPGTPHRARHEAVVADIERSYRALHAMGAV